MNPTQALLNFVGRTTLANVLDNSTKINLYSIAQPDAGSNKLQGEARPDYDTALRNTAANTLHAKGVGERSLPLANAEQIARSVDVENGRLDPVNEFDTSFNFAANNISREFDFSEVVKVLNAIFLIDIIYNDNTITRLSSYDKDLDNVPNNYYGNSQYNMGTNNYPANTYLVGIDGVKETSNIQVGDGNVGAGITVSALTPNLLNAIQTEKHINARINIRICFCIGGALDGKHIVIGPLNGGLLKIDGANQRYDNETKQSLINLTTIKTWENINQISGVRTADSYLRSLSPNDGFFSNSRNANLAKTFKEPD